MMEEHFSGAFCVGERYIKRRGAFLLLRDFFFSFTGEEGNLLLGIERTRFEGRLVKCLFV